MLIGSLDLLCVILALTVLHLGQGGAGYLNAALGAGALLAGLVTAFLVGRRHLSHTLTLSLATAVAALALIAGVTQGAVGLVLIATVGLAGTVFESPDAPSSSGPPRPTPSPVRSPSSSP